MRLKLTLNRVAAPPADIVVTTDAAATLSDVAEAIARLDPAGPAPTGERTLTLAATVPGQSAAAVLAPEAAVGESPIASGAAVALVEAGRTASTDRPPVARVRVIAGPDAGAEFPLSEGTTVLGRGGAVPGATGDVDIELHDPMVSKRHLRFEASDAVEIVDLGSANGLVVDGGLVPRIRVDRRETLLVGDSTLVVEVAPARIAAGAVPAKAGPVLFNRSPKVEARYAGEEFAAPEVPGDKPDQPFPLLAMIVPVLLGGAMFWFTGNPSSLLFVLLTPVMLVGNYLSGRTREKRRLKKAIAVFDERLESLTKLLAEERVREHARRNAESPSTLEAYEQALARGPLLWTRRPEHWSFLNVRLGVGAMPSRNTIETAARGELLQEFQERLDAVVEEHRTIPDVPIIDNLHDAGALGIAGTPEQAVGAVNSVLVQLTALHSPAELAVVALVAPSWSAPLEWL
jgi:S-DNA-T family DNA segregation ATPase FtsK/SpoIIIE